MKKKIKDYYIKEMFKPGIIGLILNPFYIARTGLYYKIKKYANYITGSILDVGCGDKPYINLFKSYTEYHGLEISSTVHKSTRADSFYDGEFFPFVQGRFNSVVTNQVLEHVFKPDNFLSEINRVMSTDGILMLTVPFVWDEHEQPFDFGRYSSFGLKNILNRNGFEIIIAEKIGNDLRVVFQLLIGYLYKIIYKFPIPFRILLYIFMIFPITLIGLFVSFILPKNNDLYLDNFVIARKVMNNINL